jgi:hypothetical protein
MKADYKIKYKTSGEEVVNVYLPKGAPKAAFLYFHGGGLVAGDENSGDIHSEYLKNNGIIAFSASYRMYPEAKYPDFIVDAAEAVKWTLGYLMENYGTIDLYVGGSSAGAYLTMMLCFDSRYYENIGVNPFDIKGYLHDAGQPTAHFNVLNERGIHEHRIIVDETAPLYYIGTAEKYPAMRFIVSDNDMINRYEQTMLTLKTLEHFTYTGFDCVLMHGKHVQYVEQLDGQGESVFGKMICDFINKISDTKG